MNLAMALMRGEAAVHAMNAAQESLPPGSNSERFAGMKQELMKQEIGPSTRWFCLLQLYFATVHVIVRTWNRGPFQNDEVKALLGDSKMVDMLTDFRDDLMHGGPLLGEEVSVFFDHLTDADAWALKLRQACEQYVVSHFATPRRDTAP
jgi:hypothetical protein